MLRNDEPQYSGAPHGRCSIHHAIDFWINIFTLSPCSCIDTADLSIVYVHRKHYCKHHTYRRSLDNVGSSSSVVQAHQSNAKHRYLDRSPRRAYPFMGTHLCSKTNGNQTNCTFSDEINRYENNGRRRFKPRGTHFRS